MSRLIVGFRSLLSITTLALLGALVSQCSATGSSTDEQARSSGGEGGGSGSILEDAGATGKPAKPTGARLNGFVWGPHPAGEAPIFPVPNALVVAYEAPPPPIPSGVYCEECVELSANTLFTRSAADGSFYLDLPPGRSYWLTVQKGQFRRVRQYTTPATVGDYDLEPSYSTLPSRTDVALGDHIPKMALVYGDYDHIEDVLAKVGIGDQDTAYGMQWGSEVGVFDVFNNAMPGEPAHGELLINLIRNPARLAMYHAVLFSCSYNANFSFMEDPLVQQNLRDYVWKGGKLYVSDYAMPVVEMVWPKLAWFTDPLRDGCVENRFPDGCNHGPPFDAPATVPDLDMRAWLDSQSMLAGFQTKENWNTIGELGTGEVGQDPTTGAPVLGTPKVWVEGPWSYTDAQLESASKDPATWDRTTPHPMTISWPYNCGRVLYTTYHTVGGTTGGRHPGLYAQERILFYLLMEMTVCQDGPVVH